MVDEPIASNFLPAALKPFLEENPQVYPSIYSGPASMMFTGLIKGDIELGFFFHTPELPTQLQKGSLLWKDFARTTLVPR